MDMHQESTEHREPPKAQYDEELGGSTRLPFVFNVEEYVAGHIEELNALTNAIGKYQSVCFSSWGTLKRYLVPF